MGDSIKQAIFEELNTVLKNPAQQNEERLNQLKYTECYGVYLAELTLDESLDQGLRQLASILLKKYVDEHWTSTDDDPNRLVASKQAKDAIKTILPEGLHSNNSKLRNTVAYTISSIASYDWPADWVELFDIIVRCLAGNNDSVHGAMQVLIEFTFELEERVKDVGPIILSEVYRIFDSESVFNVKTRSCSVEILNSLLKCVNTHIDTKDQAAFLNPVLPAFMQKLIQGLTAPNGTTSSFELKTGILRAFTYLICDMQKFIYPLLPVILPSIWSLLTQMADVYIKSVVNESEDLFGGDEDEKNEFVIMILQIFELVHSIVENKKLQSFVKDVVGDLIYVVVLYMQITESHVETWNDDCEKYVEDEDEAGVDYSIRTSGQDILQQLSEQFKDKFLIGLTGAITKLVALADAERNSGRHYWWKTHEAAMVIVGTASFKELALTQDKFNLPDYFILIKGLMSYESSPFLLGRCLQTLSSYIETESCAPHFADTINTTIASIGADKPTTLRISAARAIYSFCENLKDNENDRKAFFITKLDVILEGILQMLNNSQSAVLGLLLQALSAVLSFDVNFTASTATRVIPLVETFFLNYHDDRFILEHVQGILKIWSQNPFCHQTLLEKMLPTIINMLIMDEQKEVQLQDIALDILETIVKYSPKNTRLSDQLIESAFPAAVNAILRTDDNSVMQSGGECLRSFLQVSPEQVCTFQNGQGLNSILQVTTTLLNPMSSEYSASFIGRLIVTLITKAGNFLGDQIDLLLKAVISKMQLVESLSVMMSLVMVFAHLFLIQLDAVMNFLCSIPGPDGQQATNFIFNTWLERQHMFYGTYERKVSVMSMCKLFDYGVTTKDQRLIQVMIREPNNATASKGRTRSQAAAVQFVQVPIMVKIFKLLIFELANLREIKEALNVTLDSDDSEDEVVQTELQGSNLNAFMFGEDDETTEEDNELLQELMQDPIFQEDTEQSLTKFLTNFSRNENFTSLVEQLNDDERNLLKSLRLN